MEILLDSLNTTGMVTNLERYAINDGFGLRTTVFLKGCPLRCHWCSNPETQDFHPEMVYFQDKCIGCGACARLCRYGALEDGLIADRIRCEKCFMKENAFACVDECYTGCRKTAGEIMTVRKVLDVVKRDMPFYRRSGGGVTLSGGEPLAQPEFTLELLKALHDQWIHTAIETCGAGKPEDYEKIAPYLNLAFMDLKSMNNEKHTEWTGSGNGVILNNLVLMDQLSAKYHYPLIIRTPVIPGFNEKEGDLRTIAGFVKKNCPNAAGMELLPYHKLGRGKYTSLGRQYTLAHVKTPEENEMNRLNEILAEYKIPIYQF